jgi:hypothetical protein
MGVVLSAVVIGIVTSIAVRKRNATAIATAYTAFRNALVVGDHTNALKYCRPRSVSDSYILGRFQVLTGADYVLHTNHYIRFARKEAYLFPKDSDGGRNWAGMWINFVKAGTNWYLTGETEFQTD